MQLNVDVVTVKASESLIKKLREFYAPFNERLYEYIGQRYDWPSV
jgi:hypothetical protein